MEIVLVICLIILNGIFAMAEVALISAKKHRLQKKANEGSKRAKAALEIANNPNRFLSTVQVGITLISILAGTFGGVSIAKSVAKYFQAIPVIAPYSDTLSLVLVVSLITYLSLVIGELVPKRIGLNKPERIAIFFARPMNILSSLTSPVVSILSLSTDWLLNLLRIKNKTEASISEDEIRMMIREGAKLGIFEIAEKDIVERTFNLSDKKVHSLMTHQKEIICLDIDSSLQTLRNKIRKNPHPNYPICQNRQDKIIGIVRTEDLLTTFLAEGKIEIAKSLHKPIFIPETMPILKMLELFKKSGIHIALVIDEYGNIKGLLSLTDILEAIVGDIPTVNELEEKEIRKRDDYSWFVEGLISLDEFKDYFHIKKLPHEQTGSFHTIGGFVMHQLGKIPRPGDTFQLDRYQFEIVAMDNNRVDQILLTKKKTKK